MDKNTEKLDKYDPLMTEHKALDAIEKIIDPKGVEQRMNKTINKEFKENMEGIPANLDVTILPKKVAEVPIGKKAKMPSQKKRLKLATLTGDDIVYKIIGNKIHLCSLGDEAGVIQIDKDKFIDFFHEVEELKDILIDESIILDSEEYYEE